MPMKPKSPCKYPRCSNLCENGSYCEEHKKYSADRRRGGAVKRGYDAKWREARKLFLQKNPLCVSCMREGKLTPATVVDHVIPHRGDQTLFWDKSNWQALCKRCHDSKTGSGL